MSFDKDAAIIAQNSATVAAGLTSAIIAANPDHATTTESALALFDQVREHVFNGSIALAGAEAIVRTMESGGSGATVDRRPSQRSSEARPSGDAGSIKFNMGKHAGKSIAQVHAEAPDYLSWCVENLRNDYMRKQVSAYLATVS